ncbi:hypothetical protein C0J52_27508, partial [Blattella germanica]
SYKEVYDLAAKTIYTILTLTKNSNSIIKGHRFDVQRCKDSFLICKRWIIIAWNLSGKDDTHVAEIYIHSP